MTVRVQIPGAFRVHTAGQKTVSVEGLTVGEVLQALVSAHPSLKPQLYAPSGDLRRYINVFRGDDDIRALEHLATAVHDGQTLVIIPAISGGSQ